MLLKEAKLKAIEYLGTDMYKGKPVFSSKFDCNWKNHIRETGYYAPNACTKCVVCKYLDFLDYAHAVAPSGSTIERHNLIDRYVDYKILTPNPKKI